MSHNKISIFIPCYNVEKTILSVLNELNSWDHSCIDTLLLIDNCSQDQTINVIQRFINQNSSLASKIILLRNQDNYGLGGSQKVAYKYLLARDFTHIMVMHSDAQGSVKEIAQNFVTALTDHPQSDIILASRFLKTSRLKGYNSLRVFGNHVFNVLTHILTGVKMSDAGTGIFIIQTQFLKQFPFEHLTNSFQFNPQLNILIYQKPEASIKEVVLNWRDSDAGSNISSIKYCLTLLKILLSYRWNKSILRKKGWETFSAVSQDFEPQCDVLKEEQHGCH